MYLHYANTCNTPAVYMRYPVVDKYSNGIRY